MPNGRHLLHSSVVARYLLGLLLFGVALAARFAMIGILPPSGFPFLTFFPAVLLTAYMAGLWPGLLVSTLSTLAAWYFFIAPTSELAGLSRGDQIALIFFTGILVVDCVVIHLMNKAIAQALSTSKELRESEERMLLATEATTVGIWEWNVLTDEIRWDAVMFRIYGIVPTPNGVVHYRDWSEAVLPEELQEQHDILQDTLRRAGSSRRAFRIRRRSDGKCRHIEAVETVRTNEKGESVRVVGTNLDVTDRKQAEVALQESEHRFRIMADGLPSLIWVHDAEGNLLFINQAYRDFYRLADGGILGDRWQNLLHPDDYDRYTAEFVKASEKRSLFHAEARVRSDAGDWRWLESWGQSRFSDEGEFLGYVGNSVDITERKKNEVQLKQALADLEAARQQAQDANASKSEFLANMSHEIRTPMTAILGYAELLSGLELPVEGSDYLKTIRLNGDYLLEIINDILDLSKIEAGKLELNREQFDPARVVEDVRSIMNVRACENGLQLNVRYEGKLPRNIESDPKRLKQILINLVGNAIKFTNKGSVDIAVRFGSEQRVGQAGVTPAPHNARGASEMSTFEGLAALHDLPSGLLQFDIIDTGIGMSDEQKSKLFKPFSQGDSSVSRHFGGTGLGLAISRRLARLLGGDILAESTLGVGSTFSVTIKTGSIENVEFAEPSLVIESQPSATSVDQPTELDCRVLVVDDRRDIRFLSKRILTKAGATVDEAEDGQLGLDFVRTRLAEGNPPDLILLDMQMPNLDGYQTAEQLRAAGFVGAIIALTADAMQGDMKRCIEAGCNDYLSKPINAERLVQLVRQLTQAIKSRVG